MMDRNGMMRAALGLLALSAAAVAFGQTPGQADLEALKKTAPKVYLDCGECDIEYIKTEVTFVNYVRDRKEAQVHILITTQATGSGGREYMLNFLGQNEFKGLDDTVQYFSNSTDTDDEVRHGLVKALKIGLAGYAARTPIASRLTVQYTAPPRTGPIVDRWNSWVFSLNSSGYFNGEKSHTQNSWGANASANRITAGSKLRLGWSADFHGDRFEYEGETIKSHQESYEFNGLYVTALGDHWSAGLALDVESSTYDNNRLSVAPAPAIEFNVFPYAESSRHQLRFLYKIGFESVRYREETIYFKTRDSLFKHSLSATLEMKEKWGSISTVLSGSQYFNDLTKYQVNIFGSVNLNLLKGLSLYVAGGGGRIHDQLGLIKGEASLDEVLLQRRQLETGYNYFVMGGLSFTFGSIYTNVVNPRFGNQGSGGVHIVMN
ncbi:MAG: hypothetical protein NTZ26_14545 [Candidatus Aminicenantes bacterium]|nr:hypothetical protein [Candidatus Aminicenantes bacterium]